MVAPHIETFSGIPHRIIPGLPPAPLDNDAWAKEWYPKILAHRLRVKALCAQPGAAGQDAQEANLVYASQPGADGLLYLMNTFMWILEPRNVGKKQLSVRMPYITYPRQMELADEYDAMMATEAPDPLANMAVIKSRDVGATWFDGAHSIKNWLFLELFWATVVSANKDLAADEKNPKSYWFKLWFMLKSLFAEAPFLKPEGFLGFFPRAPHTPEGSIINPENGSIINAEATTMDATRGDRRAKVSTDESGTFDDFDAMWSNIANVTDHHVTLTTPQTRHGMGLYNLVHGKEGYTKPRLFFFRWHGVPGRDKRWYDAKKATMKEDEFSREVDLEWLAGTGEFVFPATKDMQAGDFPFVAGWPVYVAIDDGWDDDFAIVWIQKDRRRGRTRIIGGYHNSHEDIRYYGHLMLGQPSGKYFYGEWELEIMRWIREFGIFKAIYYGDRHGDNTDLSSGKSPFRVLAEEFGINVITAPEPLRNDVKYRIDATKELINSGLDVDLGHGAPNVLEALQVSRNPKRRDSWQRTTEIKAPVHGKYEAHYRAAVGYYAIQQEYEVIGDDRDAWNQGAVGIGNHDPLEAGRRFRRAEDAVLWTPVGNPGMIGAAGDAQSTADANRQRARDLLVGGVGRWEVSR